MQGQQSTDNDREWADDANWHLGQALYYSRRDSRVIVPKRQDPRLGRTLNFARGQTWFIMSLLFAAPIAMAVLLVFLPR